MESSPRSGSAICTWFVADTSQQATYFPQVAGHSDNIELQAVYWRCSVCFFASSLLLNPGQPHIFFTNCDLPTIDGLDLEQLFRRWGVQVVHLPITYRLPEGTVTSWGNQYYVLDIIKHLAKRDEFSRVIVLDSDCLWLRPVDELERSIDEYGVLTCTMGTEDYEIDQPINGMTRKQMADFLFQFSGTKPDHVAYHGGEIFASSHTELQRIASQIDSLWEVTCRGTPEGPKEEAHFLSLLYAMNGYKHDTAHRYIKRMWTNLSFNNCSSSDRQLTIWHLPGEKKSGFRKLYDLIAGTGGDLEKVRSLKLDGDTYGRIMGVPRRSSKKLVRDVSAKLVEHASKHWSARERT